MPGHSLTACGTVRTLAPGSTFTLSGHASADLTNAPHVVLRVLHDAKNNLSAQLNGHAQKLTRSMPSPIDTGASSYAINSVKRSGNSPDELFYRNAALVLPITVPYRGASTDSHGQLIHPKPSVSGSQTALVIGVAGQHLTTDRDHRVKVQFAWQRGQASQSRLAHPAADGHSGAPAEDGTSQTTGTWVRVATPLAPIAGANWGSVALPRIGQEVLVTFLGGDIDRPVITGSLYNGKGQDNAQTNQVAAGAANATGNAPIWFPGDQQASGKQGKLPGHAHTAVLSGIKTQALSASQTGQGGYNQIVFDDTPGQSRLGLQSHTQQEGGTASSGTHSGSHELNLGALRQQTDNQRLASTGYGFELKSHFSGAIRAGSGMLLTADKRQGNESGASSHQMDSKEAQSQLQTGQDLVKALTETAQQHKAMLPVLKTSEVKPEKLPAFTQLKQNDQVIGARASGSEGQYAGVQGGTTRAAVGDCATDCSWLTEHAYLVSRYNTDYDTAMKTPKRHYTITSTKRAHFFAANKTLVGYEGHLVKFDDGTSEMIYAPGFNPRTDTFAMYEVKHLADAIAQLSQLQLKTVEAFYLAPEIDPKAAAHYDGSCDSIVVFAQKSLPGGYLSDNERAVQLYETLVHECGHGLDDLWINEWDLVREDNRLDALEASLVSKNCFEQKSKLYVRLLQLHLSKASKADKLIEKRRLDLEQSILDAFDKPIHDKFKLLKQAQAEKTKQAQAERDEWKKAIKDDNWWVSKYAQKGEEAVGHPDHDGSVLIEDLAEHYTAYALAMGTPCEATMRKHMPNRAALLDKYMKKERHARIKPEVNTRAIDNTRVHRHDWKLDTEAKGPSDATSSQRNWESWKLDTKGKGPSGEIVESHDVDESSVQSSGGAGQTVAYNEPLMALSAPAGIALLTPQSASFNAGNTTSLSAGQDINLLAQANAGYSVKMGISLFTYGKASNPKKPNQETGIKLHAASGRVSSQSQSDKTQVTADKAIMVASTHDAVQVQAKEHVLLTAKGAYIKLSGGNIEVHAPGLVDFKASMKSWTSSKSESNALSFGKADLKGCLPSLSKAVQTQSASVTVA